MYRAASVSTPGKPRRPNRTAKERRAQYDRAHARTCTQLLRMQKALQHRGSQQSHIFAEAVESYAQAGGDPVSASAPSQTPTSPIAQPPGLSAGPSPATTPAPPAPGAPATYSSAQTQMHADAPEFVPFMRLPTFDSSVPPLDVSILQKLEHLEARILSEFKHIESNIERIIIGLRRDDQLASSGGLRRDTKPAYTFKGIFAIRHWEAPDVRGDFTSHEGFSRTQSGNIAKQEGGVKDSETTAHILDNR